MRQLTDSSVHSSLVFEVNGKVVTDSLVIAKILKNHLDVLKEVRKQIVYVGEEFEEKIFTSPLMLIQRTGESLNMI